MSSHGITDAGGSRRACRICGNDSGNRVHAAREMMFGSRRPFDYLECASCGCVQISDVPADPGEFYPPDYYSFAPPAAPAVRRSRLRRYLKRTWWLQSLGHDSILGRVLVRRRGAAPIVASLRPLRLAQDAAILDVGCGRGALLQALAEAGFRDLTGVDPWIDHDIVYGAGCRVLKRTLEDTVGQFDLVMMHHSFEHLADPRAVLADVLRLLKPGGTVLIRIPIAGSYAWREYGVDWVQLDAPRHFYLHTPRSFAALAREAGLTVEKTVFDSTEFQFWGSEQYRAGIALWDSRSYAVAPADSIFSAGQMAGYAREAERLNAAGDGDQACFYLGRTT